MRRRGLFSLFSTLAVLCGVSEATSAEIVCPKTIAAIDQGVISPVVAKTLSSLYQELGCSPTVLPLPGRRGIASFNSGAVDGEVMRLEGVESSYTKAFIRSDQPMFSLSNSLWRHPNQNAKGMLKIGYILGVVWQENYMRDKLDKGERFHNGESLLKAYNSGRLAGFLMADVSVKKVVKEGAISPKPVKEKVILAAPMYHYLAKEFAPFMKALTAKIAQKKPFSYIAEMQN